ncbi:plasma membrane fusion-related protein, putative [Cryptococcus deneoformans JEC21]|uniref:Plasma membrane fusion protein PRM1 n=2 Tax=Cryptococcus deneoformans (strain JEC21 / ATCC MYA-565) TaxID=214684 RepID=PRM1_CRYD1|nr:plasma membrane fusion-related protein, putative [Cryptococcus neoformans var. neoformans JEC21]P0CQ04.1 RecName: Full=Plasma membrane fusion protein PRM1 [Cryptococcus neoformans var. neoformans JEC21]AAW44262.2 plasma membrane fusion-related protein, putative [Cryptococcus neoformans var. neoformans JEC21]
MSYPQAPSKFVNPDEIIPLSPPTKPPFAQYAASPLPATPHTPYSPPSPSRLSETIPLRPYLSLLPRILLTFFSPCLLPMILTIAHLIQNRSSTASLATSLKSSVLSACSGLAKAAASIKTLPRYLAMQTNQEAIRATQASILAIGTMLMDAITIIEAVVNFIVDTYRSLLLCTIELAVRGTLEILISAVQTISDAVTDTLNSVRSNIQDDIGDANDIIQTAVSAINRVTTLVNLNISVPEFSIPALSFLQNVTIPTTFEDGLITLNSSLPTLTDLKKKMDEIIDTPFEALISEINSTRLEMAASFNSSILSVPSLSSLSANSANDLSNDLCSDLDTSLIDDTAKALHKLSSIAIGLMFLLLFLIWAALAVWEWRKWKLMKDTVDAVNEEWDRDGKSDAWRMVAIVEHPVLERYSGTFLGKIAKMPRTRTNLRWFLSYLAHPTCLALLFISLFGFLSIQFQLVALNALKAHAQSSANSTVTASTNSLVTKLNAAALNSSQEYADSYNEAIAGYQDRINNELFGSWVNTTAVTLNSTLVEFYDEVEKALNASFGGTILYNPINTFMYCILGSKITNLEKGLTWISEHAFVDLPTFPSDILLLSNDSMNEIATPIAAAAVGSGDGGDDDDGVVGTLISHFESALKVERTFYGIMLGVWLALFLIGLAVVIWNSGGREKFMALRGVPSSSSPPGYGPPESKHPRWKAWLTNNHPIYDSYAEKQFRGTTPTNCLESYTHADVPNVNNGNDDHEKSFFKMRDSHAAGPFGSHATSAVRSTIASLAAPGQSFLKLSGRKLTDTTTPYDDKVPLAPVQTSEKYSRDHANSPFPRPSSESSESSAAQPFWVDKFYGAFEGVKSFFPTRSQRLGAALARKASQRTEGSFGASQVPTARTPGHDWIGGHQCLPEKKAEPEWSMVDPRMLGRALEDDKGRYPRVLPPSEMAAANYNPHPVYPRPMSRASTLGEGMVIPSTTSHPDPFQDMPPLPPKHKRASMDYVEEYESSHSRSSREDSRHGGVTSPASSSVSYFAAEPQLVSASKVQVGVAQKGGQATRALAEIVKELQEKRERKDPFGDDYERGL